MKTKAYILPIIIFAQFACTSLWFGGNVIVDQLIPSQHTNSSFVAYMLSSVQLGFILGTLVFAFLTIADRYSPSKVFFWSALIAAGCNLLILFTGSIYYILGLRTTTGFFLAGIYPVGMKIASDYYQNGLGKALGYLVGALVLGTALPHSLQLFQVQNSVNFVIISTSVLAALGGLLMSLLVPNGPYRKASSKIQLQAVPKLFKIPALRQAAYGYFGHMWELYAFWAFIPLLITKFVSLQVVEINIPLWSFITITIGSVGCIAGGYGAIRFGSKQIAFISLSISGVLCLASPLLMQLNSSLFLTALLIWGATVIADSPQFSSLVANSAPPALTGTALTLVNSLGFAISIISIQLLAFLDSKVDTSYIFLCLTIGPALGLIGFFKGKN